MSYAASTFGGMTYERLALGRSGEATAAATYRRRGWRILERNWRCDRGEVDLIVERRGVVAFVEVKTRSSLRWGLPAEAVGVKKQSRLRSLALAWLAENPRSGTELRFDVASVHDGEVELYEAAF